MNQLYLDAIKKAGKIRKVLGYNNFEPINIFDTCEKLNVVVRFSDINMDGFYVKKGDASFILISNKRPFPRRVYTAGHELGHFVFNHGFKVDILTEDRSNSDPKDEDEILVDAFAAALLIPVGGIQVEFKRRNWSFDNSSPIQFYIISSLFAVGYQTLVKHCRYSNLISEEMCKKLSIWTPGKLLSYHFPEISQNSFFRVIDCHCILSTIDLEVNNYIVFPKEVVVDNMYLKRVAENTLGIAYIAINPGITAVHHSGNGNSYFIRIQRENYIGLAEYRHLEI
ncbi:Zn-dependent peptidase ImmA (M78 family) [Chitinophaga sp. W3I9]|uniref:ImmA/IrrE family metallo-endopeptidase n=1 Tax=Chitinophaga sp. W3I9 TaxID=3373924 RepID=UPI003D2089AC